MWFALEIYTHFKEKKNHTEVNNILKVQHTIWVGNLF